MLYTQKLTKNLIYRFCVLLIILSVNSCKKDIDSYDVLSPDKQANPFTQELYTKWVEFSKSRNIPNQLNSNERLDWKKIVLRISFSAGSSINYSIPILSGDMPCNKVLELSFARDKTLMRASVQEYTTNPTSTKQSSLDLRKLQKVLYKFSELGLIVPAELVKRELSIRKEREVNRINNNRSLASLKSNSNKSLISKTQSFRECETLTDIDFYYGFNGNDNGPSSTWGTNVATSFIQSFYNFLDVYYHLDFDEAQFVNGIPLNVKFYNTPDNTTLRVMIENSLNHAAWVTTNSFNLTNSGIYYFDFKVLESTCGNSVGDVGGGGGGVSPPDPNDPTNPDNVIVEIDANHAKLCGVIAVAKVGDGYTGGVDNLGFILTRTINGNNSVSADVLIGSGCFSTKSANAAFASVAILAAYNTAVAAVMYEVKFGIIPEVNSVTLRAALIFQIQEAIALTGGFGSTFSSGGCIGPVPATTAVYCR